MRMRLTSAEVLRGIDDMVIKFTLYLSCLCYPRSLDVWWVAVQYIPAFVYMCLCQYFYNLFLWPSHLIMCCYLVVNFVLWRRFCMQNLEIFSNVSTRFCFIQVTTDISSLSNHRQYAFKARFPRLPMGKLRRDCKRQCAKQSKYVDAAQV